MKPLIPPRLEALIRSRLGVSAPAAGTSPWQIDRYDPSEIRGGTYRPRRVRENLAYPPCVMLSDAEITSRARRRREIPVYPSPAMLPRADIARTLLRYRYDREFRGPRRVPIKTLAGYVGLSHETLFQAMRGKISDVTRAKLSWAIVAIAKGRLRFHRHGQVWQIETTAPLAIGLTRATGAQF